MKLHCLVPDTVRQLCWGHNAWLIGGFVDYLMKLYAGEKCGEFRDIDVIVPYHEWQKAAYLLGGVDAVANKFGGFEFKEDDITVDVWPDDVARVLAEFKEGTKAFHPKTRTLLVCERKW